MLGYSRPGPAAFYRASSAAQSGDRVVNCSFDSDPDAFKAPWDNHNGRARHYSLRHILLAGDLTPATFSTNDFRHCVFGNYGEPDDAYYNGQPMLNQLNVSTSLFSDFYLAGVHTKVSNTASIYTVENCTFTFPADTELPQTDQLEESIPQIPASQNTFPQTFGIYTETAKLIAMGNTFQQLDSTQTVQMDDYDQFATVRPPQTGIYVDHLIKADVNRFYLLTAGLYFDRGTVNYYPNQQTIHKPSIQGNGFVHCREGLALHPNNFDPRPILRVTCNTFRRDDQRTGTTYGIRHHYAPANSNGINSNHWPPYWPGVILDDPDNLASPHLLKNYFDNRNGNVGTYYALVNDQPNYTLTYNTFGDPSNPFSTFTQAYRVRQLSPPTPNYLNIPRGNPEPNSGPGTGPCSGDGYPNAGLQLRPSGGSPSPGTINNSDRAKSANTLSQNYPNPTAGNTTFTYATKAGTKSAELVLRRSLDGREVQHLTLNLSEVQHELRTSELAAGTYFAVLLVDGVPTATRRVVVTKTGQ